jgi:hypothetical protein
MNVWPSIDRTTVLQGESLIKHATWLLVDFRMLLNIQTDVESDGFNVCLADVFTVDEHHRDRCVHPR